LHKYERLAKFNSYPSLEGYYLVLTFLNLVLAREERLQATHYGWVYSPRGCWVLLEKLPSEWKVDF